MSKYAPDEAGCSRHAPSCAAHAHEWMMAACCLVEVTCRGPQPGACISAEAETACWKSSTPQTARMATAAVLSRLWLMGAAHRLSPGTVVIQRIHELQRKTRIAGFWSPTGDARAVARILEMADFTNHHLEIEGQSPWLCLGALCLWCRSSNLRPPRTLRMRRVGVSNINIFQEGYHS